MGFLESSLKSLSVRRSFSIFPIDLFLKFPDISLIFLYSVIPIIRHEIFRIDQGWPRRGPIVVYNWRAEHTHNFFNKQSLREPDLKK